MPTILHLTEAAQCGAAPKEKPSGKRSAKGQSRDPKAEIRETEKIGNAGYSVPDEVGNGRGDKTTRQEITVADRCGDGLDLVVPGEQSPSSLICALTADAEECP